MPGKVILGKQKKDSKLAKPDERDLAACQSGITDGLTFTESSSISKNNPYMIRMTKTKGKKHADSI